MDGDAQRAFEGAAMVLERAGARPVEVTLPDLDEAAQKWLALCGVEAALAHEATFPSRRGEYGAEFAGLLDLGRGLTAVELARLQCDPATCQIGGGIGFQRTGKKKQTKRDG